MEFLGRRQFLANSVAAAAFAGAAKADDWDAMTWLNPPAAFSRDGGVWRVRSKPKTDFWRHTFYDYVTDNGHFLFKPVKGKFCFEARVQGHYGAQYDQAGLMVRQDAENWMKCGTEFFEGRRHASVVVTHGFSDWSTEPDLSDTAAVTWRVMRETNALNVFASSDGQDFRLVRSAYFAPSQSADVGIMCCAPDGPGFEASFDKLKLS